MSNKKFWFIISVLMLISVLVAACGQSATKAEQSMIPDSAIKENQVETDPFAGLTRNTDGFTDITVEQLADTLPEKTYTLVNVHIPYAGDIPQTDLSIPFNEIVNYQDQLPNKNEPIVLYCRSGNMSTQAAQTLVELGYTNVAEVDGGMAAWQAAGYQLVDN